MTTFPIPITKELQPAPSDIACDCPEACKGMYQGNLRCSCEAHAITIPTCPSCQWLRERITWLMDYSRAMRMGNGVLLSKNDKLSKQVELLEQELAAAEVEVKAQQERNKRSGGAHKRKARAL